jgi:hypothetical protein
MKKTAFFLSVLIIASSSFLFAESTSVNQRGSGKAQLGQMQGQQGQQMNGQQMLNEPDCTKLTPDEQNFAYQINDMNNKMMFCTQFTAQQRQQAMQMTGQSDASGNIMTADQAVQQVMQTNGMTPMTQQRGRSSGGCPMK